jgi:uncharacterized membrane protein YraQ (UPF0718 family)
MASCGSIARRASNRSLATTGIIPILSALIEKGASLGTVLAFMMAVVGLSLPEAIILRRVCGSTCETLLTLE